MAFLLDPLMATLGHEADNLSFLLLLTDTILTSDYVDATMPTSIAARDKLHAVVRPGMSCDGRLERQCLTIPLLRVCGRLVCAGTTCSPRSRCRRTCRQACHTHKFTILDKQ